MESDIYMSNMSKKRVAVIFGGVSSEHTVSLVSATSVLKNLSKEKYEILMIGITMDGRWMLFNGDTTEIANGNWEKHSQSQIAFISPDAQIHGIVIPKTNTIIHIDVAFPVLHGANGEDGTIQGLLKLAQIPCVGCGVAASAICMDKDLTKIVLNNAGIPQAKYVSFNIFEYKMNANKIIEKIEGLGFPVFVKPANAGSSCGISKVKGKAELDSAIQSAALIDTKIVVEENIDGLEIECAVLGNHEPIVSICGEVTPCNDFYDYDAKYVNGTSELHIPARISEDVANRVRTAAKKAYLALGCAGMARVDFFVKKDNSILLNEPNTIPGFTAISMYPKMFEASGFSFTMLLDRLIELAEMQNVECR
jgi:D-alanine-D-alanine ligase